MIKYTMSAYRIIKQELISVSFLVTLISSLMMLAYLTYSAIVGNGERVINVVLCVITAVNFLTYIFMRRAEKKAIKHARKWIKHTCRITKLCINAVSLGIIIYAAAVAPEQVSAISLVLLPLMIILWVLQAILEIVTLYTTSRLELLINGLQMDAAPILTPVAKVKGIVGAVMGEEAEEEEPISPRNERLLKRRAEQDAALKGERRSEAFKKVWRRIVPVGNVAREYERRK